MADLATPMSVRVAATLDLAERAGSKGATVEHLAAETGTSAPALRRLLDHLVTIGVFDFDTMSSRFRPTSLGLQLTEEWPKMLLDINRAGGRADLAFVDLLGPSPPALRPTRGATAANSGRTWTPTRSCGARSTPK